MNFRINHILPLISALMILSACMKDDETDWTGWKIKNDQYIIDAESQTVGSNKVYQRIAPDWAPTAFCLIKWENDRSLTKKNLMPLDNSICDVKYAVDNIEGQRISDSYSTFTYGEGIYRCRPNQNIPGFWYALTQMHVGDKVICIIPAISGYGSVAYGSIPPYSTLVYTIELVSIPAYEVPM